MVERKLLGVVGVDSGQLVIIDPCYIKDLDHVGKKEGVRFWGQDEKQVEGLFRELGYTVKEVGGAYRIEGLSIQQFENLKPKGCQVLCSEWRDSFYDRVWDTTISPKQGGQLFYEKGHAGLAVAFQSGIGDGTYKVWATYEDLPGFGRRITKVEIELLKAKDR